MLHSLDIAQTFSTHLSQDAIRLSIRCQENAKTMYTKTMYPIIGTLIMLEPMVNDAIQFTIRLPLVYERRLRLWAMIKGTTRANLATNLIQSRIEANLEAINRDLEEIARIEGKTVEDLISEVLNHTE
jgi:hypothetical protein